MYSLIKKNIVAVALIVVASVLLMSLPVFAASTSGTHTPVDGVTVSVSGATDNSMTGGAITVTAKGSAGIFGLGASDKTATITISNNSGATATISFDWTATSVNQLIIDNTTYSASSGSFSKVMDSGASVTATITTAKNNTENKLVMSNFAIVAAAASSNVTFNFDSSLGSVTVDGVAIADGAVKEIPSSGAALVATPKSGATFLGWVDTTKHTRLSADASYTITPAEDMTVEAVFVNSSSNAWFLVDNAYMTDDLNTAVTLGTTVVPMHDGILPAGNYTIPSGVTLLIPYDSANTLYTTAPELVTDNAAVVTPTAFRTLTMAKGAHITVEGAMSLSGKVHAYMGTRYQNSAPTGPSGFVKMEEGSSITVKGVLYAWGYIVGSGTVTAESGSTIYECFQVRDWRGGDATSTMNNNTQRVFPVSQYYVQNIEVPLTLKYGAKEKGFLATYVSYMKKTAEFTFIGSDGMFRLSDANSSVTKKYDGTTDRLIVDVNGNMTMSSIVISIDTGIIGSVTLNSANYVLPINSNITVSIHEGSNVTVDQDIALLPGSVIEIEKDANLTLGTGKSIFVYDQDDWGAYCVGSVKFRAVCWAYSRTYTRKEADLVDAQIIVNGYVDASAGSVYTTTGGANICSTGNGSIKLAVASDTITYQATQSDTDISYSEVEAKPAKLMNSDSEYVETAEKGAGTYNYINGYWHLGTCQDNAGDAATCTTAQICTVCEEELVAALGHDMQQTTAAVAPTCTDTGKTAVLTCANGCGTTEGGATVAATGHTPNADDGDCTTAITCSVCDAVTTAAKTHVFDNDSDATCNNTGCKYTREVATYSVTITWSQTSTATYTPGTTTYTWSPSDLKYTASTTEGSWNSTTSVMTVTINNTQSTGAVTASFTYAPTIASTMSGDSLTVEAGKSDSRELEITPTGDPDEPETGNEVILGIITITLSKENNST